MRKLLCAILVMSLCLFGCSKKPPVKVVGRAEFDIPGASGQSERQVTKFEFEDHTYVEFMVPQHYGNGYSTVHSPECSCWKRPLKVEAE